ncbi:hypothetical protein MUP65_02540 [Patescibacteria group bacterium]|nr:hypothetical protein [Patescibacteria group bacterium]
MKRGQNRRLVFIFGLQLLLFAGLVFRLVELQLVNGAKNRVLAEENRVRRELLPAGRGNLFDRRGQQLVENVPLYFLPGEEMVLLTRDQALKMEANSEEVEMVISRHYLYKDALAHFLGYVGQPTSEEVDFWLHLSAGDLVGRGGVEEAYDEFLRGSRGWEIYEVDAQGQKVRIVGAEPARAGDDLYLAVDVELSKTAFEAIGDQVGAAIVTEAKTGRVLALVSSPSFNPNNLTIEPDEAAYLQLANDDRQPFFNRAISGTYQPGSTFKIVTAVAGLEEEKINGSTLIEDSGTLKVGEYSYRNWYFSKYGQTEGWLNVVDALKRSNDIFFYKLGELIGPQSLADWAKELGLGEKTGIGLPGEARGLVPDPDWKRRVKGERWYLGNTYHFAIGQSDLLTTPLQINSLTGVIANGGRWCRPILELGEEPECVDLGLKEETLRLVRSGMEAVCRPGGTANLLFDFEPAVACKTGTAQFGLADEERTHGWLTAYAPANDPQIVVTVLVEASEKGSSDAVPVVKEILTKWFELENQATVIN